MDSLPEGLTLIPCKLLKWPAGCCCRTELHQSFVQSTAKIQLWTAVVTTSLAVARLMALVLAWAEVLFLVNHLGPAGVCSLMAHRPDHLNRQ